MHVCAHKIYVMQAKTLWTDFVNNLRTVGEKIIVLGEMRNTDWGAFHMPHLRSGKK